LFPGKFWEGLEPRFRSSNFNFQKEFVEDDTQFERAIRKLKELLKVTNTTTDPKVVNQHLLEKSGDPALPYVGLFRLQLFLPLASLCGLVRKDQLFLADFIEPDPAIATGSYATLLASGFAPHQHSSTLKNVCRMVNLQPRETTGEALVCECGRKRKRLDLFVYGQHLLHLFKEPSNEYMVRIKKFGSKHWQDIDIVSDDRLKRFHLF
jgi:hypothetical protein